MHGVHAFPLLSLPSRFPSLVPHPITRVPVGALLSVFCGCQGGGWAVGGWIMASMLARHTSSPHHPDTQGSCVAPPSALHTPLPPLSAPRPPQEPLAFLGACGSHKSANPPALLTASPQREKEGERDIESDRLEAVKPQKERKVSLLGGQGDGQNMKSGCPCVTSPLN